LYSCARQHLLSHATWNRLSCRVDVGGINFHQHLALSRCRNVLGFSRTRICWSSGVFTACDWWTVESSDDARLHCLHSYSSYSLFSKIKSWRVLNLQKHPQYIGKIAVPSCSVAAAMFPHPSRPLSPGETESPSCDWWPLQLAFWRTTQAIAWGSKDHRMFSCF